MKRLTAVVIAIAAMLALPAAGHASQSFGSLLKNSPANGSDKCVEDATGPCTIVSHINPNDAGDPVTSPAPADGVIVKFRLRTTAAEAVTLRLATVNLQGENLLAQGVGAGPTVTTQGTGEIEEFDARLPVKAGQHLALDAASSHMVYNQGGNKFAYIYSPALAAGQGPRAQSAEPVGELLLQAVMEPDADGDGLGDETQDPRVGQDDSGNGNADVAPVVESLRVAGGRIKYRLSEDAKVRFRIEKRKNGRFAKVRALSRDASAGANTLRLRGLADGRYRVIAVATDGAGNKSAAKRARFRVR